MKPAIPSVATASTGQPDAKAASIAACRALESALVAALDAAGERMRGLDDLGQRGCMFRAARVRGAIDQPLDIPASYAGHPRLCVDDRGRLVMACLVRKGRDLDVQWTPVADAELLAEDGEALAMCLARVVADHLERVEHMRERYDGLRRVSEAVTAALAIRKGGK